MRAVLVNPAERSFEAIELDGVDQIKSIIGFDTLIADDIDDSGDRLYFDEECFLRGTRGRFQLDKLVPVSGKAVIVGSTADGSLADHATSVETLKQRVQFLDQ